jgi:hypothetical protein
MRVAFSAVSACWVASRVVAFRGADITKYVARRGPRVYLRTFRPNDRLAGLLKI